MVMKKIGSILIPDSGKEAFQLAIKNSSHTYEVEKTISGYFRILCDGEYIHDDSAFEDVNEEDTAYYFFADLVKELEHV